MGAHRMTQVALDSMLNVDKSNILTVLHNTQRAQCTDPRDRLYGILGIMTDNQDVNIDYSIPVEEVYRNWAVKRIQRTHHIDIFGACADSGRFGQLPSWVPDLRMPIGQDKALWLMCNGGELSVSRTHSPVIIPRISEDCSRLSVAGFEVDVVSAVGMAADATRNGVTGVPHLLVEIVEMWEQWLRDH